MDFLEQLNDSQREAVVNTEGASLVIAGAGSGKTRVLTYRIAYLLQQGVKPHNILALTFTNKAAREMRERVAQLVSAADVHYLWMGTFHAICSRMLRHDANILGYTSDFSIYDTADSKSLIKQIVKEMQLDDKQYKPAVVLSRISMAKNALISVSAYASDNDIARQDRINRLYAMPDLYALYQQRLKQANAMDFDDLLTNTCYLLQHNEQARHYYQQIFRYVLVDEYQDTNFAQYLIVKLLAEPENNICVVGDDAQSIYSFRGADIRNILTFRQGYPDARLFKLERNYRSTQTIVEAAGSLISHNENQIPKHVFSKNDIGDRLPLTGYTTDRDEAAGVVQSIYRQHLKGENYEQVAVLYRTNAQSRVFENELRRLNIPYRIYGSTSFYQRKEIKDAIAYFRFITNPKDNEALLRIINYPSRGVGVTTINRIAANAAQNNVAMIDTLTTEQPIPLNLASATQRRLNDFLQLVNTLTEAMDTMDAFQFAEHVLRVSGVMTAAAMDSSPEGREHKQNLDELLSGIHEFVDQRLQEGVSFTPIQDFLAEVSLLTDQDENTSDNTERVTLMTVHAAKGLEFETVYIVGLEENLFPSQFSQSGAELEEERRLLYVAITRAMVHCRLSYAKERFRNGTFNFCTPSRFLKDIDRRYLQLVTTERPWQEPTIPMPTPQRLIKPQVTTPIESDFQAGDRVRHRVFGDGTVKLTYNENDNNKIDIIFDKVGQKTLLLTYAKLEPIV
ncbi:MAG: UvrD-helicase domain-containing protein [Paludibacteraceae bacterium]|nr:UvrD-helicase domain-containing protein [Paludibacteraceae bacterium]